MTVFVRNLIVAARRIAFLLPLIRVLTVFLDSHRTRLIRDINIASMN